MENCGAPFQWLIRALARITTSAPNLRAQPFLPKCWVEHAEARGWRIRLARPRNFILWRNHLSSEMPCRILVLPHRECGLSSTEFAAVVSDLAQRAGLPDFPFGVEGAARHYWLDRAECRLIERIAPVAGQTL